MDIQITPNFRFSEFACRCGCSVSTPVAMSVFKMAEVLQIVRTRFNRSVFINSGYRCVSHNAKVGGASRSYHLRGMAVDIRVSGLPPKEVFSTLVQMVKAGVIPAGGLKAYDSFVHYDIRGSLTLF